MNADDQNTVEAPVAGLSFPLPLGPANPLDVSQPPIPPREPQTRVLAAGSVHGDGAFPLPCDIIMHADADIPTRSGLLRADIFRPVTDETVPAIVAYTPYGKRGGRWSQLRNATMVGVPAGDLSFLQAFEAPDPGYWCDQGYAIVVVDAAGTGHSEGDEYFVGSASARNVYDVIEWLAEQSWCSGKVGMGGSSYLGMIQWATAAEKPPHLAAIAPWEGTSDPYRELMVRGGIPDGGFWQRSIQDFVVGQSRTENMRAGVELHPFFDEYWQDKRARFEEITIPAYVLASWTSPIHTRGTLQAFRELGSSEKWLRVHDNQEWIELVDKNSVEDLRRFFDRYLKGIPNGWEDTPRVRLSVLDPGGSDEVGRPEQEWPLERQQWYRLWLDASSHALLSELPSEESVASYRSDDAHDSVTFSVTADEDLEITGYLNLHVWVEADTADDLDLFVALYKESVDGRRLHHIVVRDPSLRRWIESQEVDGKMPATWSYTGPLGRLRVSHRELDALGSTPSEPALAHRSEARIAPGTCVPVEIGLWPTAMKVNAGERLVIEVAGHPVGPLGGSNSLPGGDIDVPTRNRGLHRIRTGGGYDSHLLLPLIPRPV
ncbi:CocE/NonD family hydrolase [Microbacterium sp. NPDC058062]|uniref:CocE/NonD family hydrolase n=1 Tax=Microbacterium sp. NPDC058062 TaxID=3346320 RepID=UPI0036D7992C